MISAWMQASFAAAYKLNRSQILAAVPELPGGAMLDLGCGDGEWTLRVAERARALKVEALEFGANEIAAARARGLRVSEGNLNQPWPFADGDFNFVHANQVLEHVPDVDHFARELRRVLKPGRIAVVSTENAASWHNVFALVFGWQMFSLTNMSTRALGLGNPLAQKRGQGAGHPGHVHRVIFSYRGLKEFFSVHGFEVLRVRGAGYYPAPAFFGVLDPRHAAFITVSLRRMDP